MASWWGEDPEERYWCEITDRRDIGADLKCPQTKETGAEYWSYSLINRVAPGDVVFHYSTRSKAFVGASVAGAPLEERAIVWAPHGTSGRAKRVSRQPRPGWWLPLYHFTRAETPLQLEELQSPEEQTFIRSWIETHEHGPLQPYPGRLRGAQGYLTKMPGIFVQRWSKLSELVDRLSEVQEELSKIAFIKPHPQPTSPTGSTFHPKNDDDYKAVVEGGIQVRSRKHESLVRDAGNWLVTNGAAVSNPHPIDLLLTSPRQVIIEAKIVRGDNPLFAVREAVGQLHEYRYFIGPNDAALCLLLDCSPGLSLVRYIEDELQMFVFWREGPDFTLGPKTTQILKVQAA